MRNQGALPSNTETNPREHVRAVTLKSEKKLKEPNESKVYKKNEKEDVPNKETLRDEETKSKKKGKTKSKEEKEIVKPYVPLLSFP